MIALHESGISISSHIYQSMIDWLVNSQLIIINLINSIFINQNSFIFVFPSIIPNCFLIMEITIRKRYKYQPWISPKNSLPCPTNPPKGSYPLFNKSSIKTITSLESSQSRSANSQSLLSIQIMRKSRLKGSAESQLIKYSPDASLPKTFLKKDPYLPKDLYRKSQNRPSAVNLWLICHT